MAEGIARDYVDSGNLTDGYDGTFEFALGGHEIDDDGVY
jgi:hypothetical protein